MAENRNNTENQGWKENQDMRDNQQMQDPQNPGANQGMQAADSPNREGRSQADQQRTLSEGGRTNNNTGEGRGWDTEEARRAGERNQRENEAIDRHEKPR